MPGGRTRYPMTIRRMKLELAMETRAMIKTSGIMVCGNSFFVTLIEASRIGRDRQGFSGRQNKIGFVHG